MNPIVYRPTGTASNENRPSESDVVERVSGFRAPTGDLHDRPGERRCARLSRTVPLTVVCAAAAFTAIRYARAIA